jgi:hypothetical protein
VKPPTLRAFYLGAAADMLHEAVVHVQCIAQCARDAAGFALLAWRSGPVERCPEPRRVVTIRWTKGGDA